MTDTLRVRVGRVEPLAAGIKRFTLQPCDGGALPAFSSGSHVVVHMDSGRLRNATACAPCCCTLSRISSLTPSSTASSGTSRPLPITTVATSAHVERLVELVKGAK